MIKLFDRVKVNTSTTGTGDVTFGAAASTAFLTPAEAGVLDSDEVRYVIVDGLDFEEGVGLIKDTVATMERTVTKSKIGGVVGTSALNLSGTAVLALSASAADILTPGDNLASVKDTDTALDNLGGSAVGKAVFTAVDQAAARASLEIETLRQNVLLDRVYQSKALTYFRKGAHAIAIGFQGASDALNAILTASSSNYTTNSAIGNVVPTVTSSTVQINAPASSAAAQTYTMIDRTTAVLNSVTVAKIGVYSTTARTIKLKILLRNFANNYTAVVDQSYSHGGSGWEDATLTTPYTVPASGTYYLGAYIASGGANPNVTGVVNRAYVQADLTGTMATTAEDSNTVFPMRYVHSMTIGNMTIVTVSQTADASVSNGRALIEFDNTSTPALGTDLTIEVSCNGGANWASASSYSVVTAHSQTERKVVETEDISCTAGTSYQVRVKTLTHKNIPIYGLSLVVH